MATEGQIRECAKRAAEEIRVNGWAQDDEAAMDCDQPDGRRCVLTATSHELFSVVEAVRCRFARLIPSPVGEVSTDIVAWNDDPARTADEVISILERVAAGEGV